MSKRTRLTIKKAKNDEKTFGELADMLLALHRAVGIAPFAADKACGAVYSVLEQGMVYIARMGGKNVGTLALTESDLWYSDTKFLQDAWWWVDPAFRAKDIGVALLKAAKADAEARNQILIVSTTDPDRRPRKTGATIMAQAAGYVPLGYTLQMR